MYRKKSDVLISLSKNPRLWTKEKEKERKKKKKKKKLRNLSTGYLQDPRVQPFSQCAYEVRAASLNPKRGLWYLNSFMTELIFTPLPLDD